MRGLPGRAGKGSWSTSGHPRKRIRCHNRQPKYLQSKAVCWRTIYYQCYEIPSIVSLFRAPPGVNLFWNVLFMYRPNLLPHPLTLITKATPVLVADRIRFSIFYQLQHSADIVKLLWIREIATTTLEQKNNHTISFLKGLDLWCVLALSWFAFCCEGYKIE